MVENDYLKSHTVLGHRFILNQPFRFEVVFLFKKRACLQNIKSITFIIIAFNAIIINVIDLMFCKHALFLNKKTTSKRNG